MTTTRSNDEGNTEFEYIMNDLDNLARMISAILEHLEIPEPEWREL
jgi:hypothetical protein